MNAKSKELLLEHIKTRQDVPAAYLNVQKLLENAKTGLYAKACCSRIEAAGLVDEVHIFHEDSGGWNLSVDDYGMERCREILESYVHADELNPLYESFRAYNDWVTSINNMLYSLRKTGREDLEKGLVDAVGYHVENDETEDVLDLLKAELECRKLPARVRKTVRKVYFVYQMLRMVRVQCRSFIPLVKESWAAWDKNGNKYRPEENGKYSKAMRRFLDVHGGNSAIRKLHGDCLIKYIYLAVKAHGREIHSEERHRRIKQCREIEHRYRIMRHLMDAVGRLTPRELLQMYPVEKTFDGGKWGNKDYFYTMERVNALPADRPIGDAQDAACLLWDYQNQDLEFLLLQWMNVLGDLRIYCNDPDPDDEFHNKLLRREKGDEGTTGSQYHAGNNR